MESRHEDQYKTTAKAFLLAPLIFVCHVIEEAPGFVAWFNAHDERFSINHRQAKRVVSWRGE